MNGVSSSSNGITPNNMKENKEQKRSAALVLSEIFTGELADQQYKQALQAMEEFASQFKPSGVKTFTVEDMEEAFMAGMNANEYDQWVKDNYTFEQWIAKYKVGSL